MVFALPFPEIGPEIFAIEFGEFRFALRWYAMAYIVGILIGWRIVVGLVRRPHLWRDDSAPMNEQDVEDLLTWIILGVILGGRLGFVLFYQPAYYLANPIEILYIWQGGMAFHGGFLGVALVLIWFSRTRGLPLMSVADALAIATPPAIMLGRIANFINAELWGRPTDLPWGVVFPGDLAQFCPGFDAPCARHPSQLYEAGLEGLLLGAVLLLLARRGWLKAPGALTGMFLAGYGLGRFIVEYFRQADPQFITADNPLGHVIRLGELGVSMGQLLSLPMLIIGVIVIFAARRHARA
ncbi:MAG: prolipoprotein diacylglyceryl transferase [Rhodobacteraceae bacterium]|nr:prolipoprotein diacylglyceryl transferase [Paracoccaceae bacterium]